MLCAKQIMSDTLDFDWKRDYLVRKANDQEKYICFHFVLTIRTIQGVVVKVRG